MTTAPRYTIARRKEWGIWLVYRDHENIACATTEQEARSLVRYYQEGC